MLFPAKMLSLDDFPVLQRSKPCCIITGCDIQFAAEVHDSLSEPLLQHGDLWELADCYIFNAVGEPQPGSKSGHSSYLLTVRAGDRLNYFERRNVFVVPKSEASLNPAAIKYVTKGAAR